MLLKTLLGTALFAIAGAAIGYSQILCAGGECAITGTPAGGAIFGGFIGLAVMSSFKTPLPTQTDSEPSDSQIETKQDKTA